MPPKKKNRNKGLRLYNRILKQFTAFNETLPAKNQLSLEERRKLISQSIYPSLKGMRAKDLKVGLINERITQEYSRLSIATECDPNYIHPSTIEGISWQDMDEVIQQRLPKCINIKITAGDFGSTEIFNTENYDYYDSGLRDITEAIREELGNESGTAFYDGYRKLRAGRENDGTPDNYYIDFILTVDYVPLGDDTVVDYEIPEENQKKELKIRNRLLKKIKQLKNKKIRKKKARANTIKRIKDLSKVNKKFKSAKRGTTKAKLELERVKAFNKANAYIQMQIKRGNLSKEQESKFVQELFEKYFGYKKDGGIV